MFLLLILFQRLVQLRLLRICWLGEKMKKIILLLFLVSLFSVSVFAQTPTPILTELTAAARASCPVSFVPLTGFYLDSTGMLLCAKFESVATTSAHLSDVYISQSDSCSAGDNKIVSELLSSIFDLTSGTSVKRAVCARSDTSSAAIKSLTVVGGTC